MNISEDKGNKNKIIQGQIQTTTTIYVKTNVADKHLKSFNEQNDEQLCAIYS